MPVKERLKQAGITAGTIVATAAGEAGIASQAEYHPILAGAILGGAGGVVAAKEIICEARFESNKCLKNFTDYLDMKSLNSEYEHECKRHRSTELKKPCVELEAIKEEVAEREAEWKKACSCEKLEGVI